MNIAKTLKDKALLLFSYVVIAAISAYLGAKAVTRRAEKSIELLTVSCGLTATAQHLAVFELLRKENSRVAEERILKMARQHLSLYEETKRHQQFPAEIQQVGDALYRRLKEIEATMPGQ